MSLRARGEGVVTAGDIIAPPEIEVLNPDLYLFTIGSNDTALDIEFMVEQGHGYEPSEDRGKMGIGELPSDAIFSPVRRVAFDVERARVGQMTNYDRLTLDIWTDGRVQPLDALRPVPPVARLQLGVGLEDGLGDDNACPRLAVCRDGDRRVTGLRIPQSKSRKNDEAERTPVI